jgi:uncharacterized phage protein (TIGR02220 family)
MARPQKNGLDYFPLDVYTETNYKIELLEAKYGLEGFGLWIKLCQKIYSNWYFVEYSEDKGSVWAKRAGITFDRFKEILEFMICKGVFHQGMFQKYCILTCSGIQKRWLKACEKRSRINVIREFWLIDETEIVNERVMKKMVSCDINSNFTGVFSEKTPQSKGKEIKEKKKNIYKENGGEAPPNPPLSVESKSEDFKEEKETPKPQPGKQDKKQAEKQRINQQAIEIIDYLNRKTGKKYRHSKANLTVIAARLKEGFTLDDCKRVIDTKTAQWLNDEKEKYLRPETLFRPSKFEGYLNERPPGSIPQQQKKVNHMTVSQDFSFEKRIEEIQRRKRQQAQQNRSNSPPQEQQPGV